MMKLATTPQRTISDRIAGLLLAEGFCEYNSVTHCIQPIAGSHWAGTPEDDLPEIVDQLEQDDSGMLFPSDIVAQL